MITNSMSQHCRSISNPLLHINTFQSLWAYAALTDTTDREGILREVAAKILPFVYSLKLLQDEQNLFRVVLW